MPVPPCRILYSFDSYNSCGCFVLTDSCGFDEGAGGGQTWSARAFGRRAILERAMGREPFEGDEASRRSCRGRDARESRRLPTKNGKTLARSL